MRNVKIKISDFDNHLMNGLNFCRKAYAFLEDIRKSPDGVRRLRLREGRMEKKLIEELRPISRYVQARYCHGRQLKVRWIDGTQNFDARIISKGVLVEKGLVPKRQNIEVTTAVHEKDHILRRHINEHGHTFDVKGIKKDSISKEY